MAPGEGSADFWYQTRPQNWLKFYTTSLWPTPSSSCTGRPTTSTCGWGPSLNPLCPAGESASFCPACCPGSSELWGTETGGSKGLCRLWRCQWRNMTLSVSWRFWWEKDGVFTKAQREHLRSISLSRIICDNSHIARVPADPFSHTGKVEDTMPCSHPLIPHLDLQPWKQPDSGEEDHHSSRSGFTAPPQSATPVSDPRCGPIPRIQSGYWLLCDSVVLYQCRMGFKLSGSSSTSCDPVSQQWSSRPPTCRGTNGGRWWSLPTS